MATPLPASPLAYAACFDSVLVCSDCHRAITPGEWYWKRQIHNYHEDDDEWEWDPREDPPEDYWLEGMLGSTLLCRWCVKLKGYKKDRTLEECCLGEKNPKAFWRRRRETDRHRSFNPPSQTELVSGPSSEPDLVVSTRRGGALTPRNTLRTSARQPAGMAAASPATCGTKAAKLRQDAGIRGQNGNLWIRRVQVRALAVDRVPEEPCPSLPPTSLFPSFLPRHGVAFSLNIDTFAMRNSYIVASGCCPDRLLVALSLSIIVYIMRNSYIRNS